MNDNEEVSMTKEQLMELIRVVVFETVKEIKQYESNAIEAMQEEEAEEEYNAQVITQLRTRAAFLASAMKNHLKCDVKPVDNKNSVELFILSDDHRNGNSIRVEVDEVIVKQGRNKEGWSYDSAKSYRSAAESALRHMIADDNSWDHVDE